MAPQTKQPQTEPEYQIDDLTIPPYTLEMKAQHLPPRAYRAIVRLADIQAAITLRRYDDPHYPGAYILDEEIDRTSALGTMGRKQEERAKVLLARLRERVNAELVAAGWLQKWQSPRGSALWLYVEHVTDTQTESPLASRAIRTHGEKKIRAYERTITQKLVTVTCSNCGQQTTRAVYPGAAPRYCEPCAEKIEKQKRNERRMKSYYAGQAKKAKVEDGRPDTRTPTN